LHQQTSLPIAEEPRLQARNRASVRNGITQ
jgi:hypothetical protein